MLRILDALQFIQKQFQIGLRYYKQLDTVFNRLTTFTGVLIYDKQGRQLYHNEGGLSLKRLMDCITPEMLEPYGITMIRPREAAIKVDQEPPVIGKYEAESYLQLRDNYVERFRQLYDNAKRFARHLESKQTSQHPVVATWDGEKVVTKALVWANQYVAGKERDWHNFIKNRLDELTSGMCGNDAFPFEEEAVGVPIGQ